MLVAAVSGPCSFALRLITSPALTVSSGDSRRPALSGGGAGTGKEPAAGADLEPGGALPGPGGPSPAAGPDRNPTGTRPPPALCRLPLTSEYLLPLMDDLVK